MTDKTEALTQQLQKAIQLHQDGLYSQAESCTRQILDHLSSPTGNCSLLDIISVQFNNLPTVTLDTAEMLNCCGEILHNIGDVDAAISCYKRAIEKRADYAPAYNNMGNAVQTFNEYGQSALYYKKAISLQTDYVEAYHNCGHVLRCQGYPDKAVPFYLAAIRIDSSFADGWLELGHVYFDLGQISEAENSYQNAIVVKPNFAKAHNALGVLLREFGDLDKALKILQKALKIQPDYINALINLGRAYRLLEQFDNAQYSYQQALKIDPENPKALAALASLLQETCSWSELDRIQPRLLREIQKALASGDISPETVFSNVTSHIDPAFNLSTARSWGDFIVKKIHRSEPFQYAIAARCWSDPTKPAGKIRLGYLANDFSNPAVLHPISELFKLHDRSRFKVYCYSYGITGKSPDQALIRESVDHFIDISELSFTNAAERINSDKINILIDMVGHTRDNRMEICALKPAPLQISYMGFPGTSGSNFMDIIIADRITIPEDQHHFYSEKVVYLPNCYRVGYCKQDSPTQAISRSEYLLPESGIIFSAFSQPHMVDAAMFKAWMVILAAVPESVLWLLQPNKTTNNNLIQAAEEAGINKERLIFSKQESDSRHIAKLQLVDMVLDSRIYNAQNPSSDALWAGVPVITMEGGHFASRIGSSILQTMQLPELVANTLEAYQTLAIHLATQPDALTAIRQKIQRNRLTSPLFSTSQHTQELEAAFSKIWQEYLIKRSTQPKIY
jgi:protein O-GlcNAc transferase